MERALWLLLWLRLLGWGRRIGLNLTTVKGALLAILGGGMLLLWIGSLVLSRFLPGRPERIVELDTVRLYGPLVLLLYCVLTSAFSAGERAVTFSPAEVNFLFPGPFTRRKLLIYKIMGTFLTSTLTTIFLTLVLSQYSASLLTAFVGILLAMLFMQMFAMAVALTGALVGGQAYNRRRRIVMAVLFVALGVGAVLVTREADASDTAGLIRAAAQSPVVQTVLAPLRWFIEVFTAEQVWPDFVVSTLLSLLVLGVLLGIVLGLDASYLETAAAASERTYARVQRLRMGGGAAAWGALSGKARFSIPTLPVWGGLGPVVWRQLVTASRSLKGLIIFLIFMTVIMIWPYFLGNMDEGGKHLPHFLGSSLLGVSLFALPMMLTFDFRGDVDRIDVLKSLPITAWRIALGQLLTPALMISVIQIGLATLLQVLWGGLELQLLAVIAFALPVNFLLIAVENLLFLWFPTRMTPATPGDFQAMGRYMLLFMAKGFIFGLTLGAAFLTGTVVYVLSDDYFLAAAAGWPVVCAGGLAFVPIIAQAFRRFDVARDTPP